MNWLTNWLVYNYRAKQQPITEKKKTKCFEWKFFSSMEIQYNYDEALELIQGQIQQGRLPYNKHWDKCQQSWQQVNKHGEFLSFELEERNFPIFKNNPAWG